MLSASELHRRGLRLSNAGRHAAARVTFRQALTRTDDRERIARITVSLAHVEAELGTAERGLELCSRVLRSRSLPSEVRGLALGQLGLLQMRTGDGRAAMTSFSSALPHLDHADSEVARVHLNRGIVHLQRGEATAAADDFQAAAQHFRAAGLPQERAKAAHNLGCARLLEGQLAHALSLMDEARPDWAVLSPAYEAICEQDRAEVLLAAGMIGDAEGALRRAAQAFGSRRMRQRQGEAEVVLARLLLRNDAAEAARTARRAQRRFNSTGSAAWATRAEAIEVTARIESGRASSAVVDRARLIVTELRRQRLLREAQALELEVARACLRHGDIEAARTRVARFRGGEATPLEVRLLHREVRAEMSEQLRRPEEALGQIRRGLADLHDWQSSFGSLDLQSSLVGHGRRLAMQGMGLAVEDGRPDVIFEWSERARALASRVTPVRPPNDPEGAKELTDLRRVQADLSAAEAAGRATTSLQRRIAELRRRIRQRQWYGAGSGEVREPASLEATSAGLQPDDGALVAYLGVDDRLVALTLTGHGARTHELTDLTTIRQRLAGMQADLDMSATRLPAALRATVHEGLRARLDELAVQLVTPLLEDIGDRPLVVVPSGSLAGVPWTLLPGLLGRPVTVPQSATTWLATRGRKAAAAGAGFVAGPHVDRAVEEVHSAAKAWANATVLVGDDAEAEQVGRLAASVDVFHAAAHGRHSADNPLFSGLELADGPWFGYDIDQLEAIPSTVILSACELGRSSVRWGEETIGMTVAWLHAGARTVVASPASVDDDVACYTLAATHHYLAAGRPPAEALAEAMVEVGGPVPAPFVCFGSGW